MIGAGFKELSFLFSRARSGNTDGALGLSYFDCGDANAAARRRYEHEVLPLRACLRESTRRTRLGTASKSMYPLRKKDERGTRQSPSPERLRLPHKRHTCLREKPAVC